MNFFNSFAPAGITEFNEFDYQARIAVIHPDQKVQGNILKFFKTFDIEKNGIVTRDDYIGFLEALKANGRKEFQMMEDIKAIQT